MKGGAHILADRSVVGFHSLADPVEHDADKTVLIEISDKIFLRLSDGCPDGLFLDNTHDQIVGQAEEEVFNLFTVQGTVGIHNESFVFVDCLKNLQKSFLPVARCFFALECAGGFLEADPFHQVIDILEMIIKSHSADPAVSGEVVDRDLCQRLFEKKPLERFFQSPFGHVGQKLFLRFSFLLIISVNQGHYKHDEGKHFFIGKKYRKTGKKLLTYGRGYSRITQCDVVR